MKRAQSKIGEGVYGSREQGHQGYPLDNTRLLDFFFLRYHLLRSLMFDSLIFCCSNIEQRRLPRPAIGSNRINVSRHHFLHHFLVFLFT